MSPSFRGRRGRRSRPGRSRRWCSRRAAVQPAGGGAPGGRRLGKRLARRVNLIHIPGTAGATSRATCPRAARPWPVPILDGPGDAEATTHPCTIPARAGAIGCAGATSMARRGGRSGPCPRHFPRYVNGTPASGERGAERGGRHSRERRAGGRAGWPALPRAASGAERGGRHYPAGRPRVTVRRLAGRRSVRVAFFRHRFHASASTLLAPGSRHPNVCAGAPGRS